MQENPIFNGKRNKGWKSDAFLRQAEDTQKLPTMRSGVYGLN